MRIHILKVNSDLSQIRIWEYCVLCIVIRYYTTLIFVFIVLYFLINRSHIELTRYILLTVCNSLSLLTLICNDLHSLLGSYFWYQKYIYILSDFYYHYNVTTTYIYFYSSVCFSSMKMFSSFFLSGMRSPYLSCAISCESWKRRRTSSGRRWFAAMRRIERDCRRRWGSSERLLKASTTLDYCPLVEGRTEENCKLWQSEGCEHKKRGFQHLEEGMISDDKRRERWDGWGNKRDKRTTPRRTLQCSRSAHTKDSVKCATFLHSSSHSLYHPSLLLLLCPAVIYADYLNFLLSFFF